MGWGLIAYDREYGWVNLPSPASNWDNIPDLHPDNFLITSDETLAEHREGATLIIRPKLKNHIPPTFHRRAAFERFRLRKTAATFTQAIMTFCLAKMTFRHIFVAVRYIG